MAATVSSRLARTGAAAAAALLLTAGATGAPRLDGEHGLWVRLHGDSVVVQWLTATAAPGSIEVLPTHGGPLAFSTATAQSHRVAFPADTAVDLLLRYGAATRGAPVHSTRISLRMPERDSVVFPAVDSLYVIGDTHGDFDALVAGLSGAGLIDRSLRWRGGRAHVAFAGDLTDRGPDVLRLLWFVYGLERQARAAGGRVHVLLGNHEIMVMLADLRYVHPKEMDVARLHGTTYERLFDVRQSILGRWLASKPAAIRVGDVLIAHGGITSDIARLGIREFDDTLARYMGEELFYRWNDSTAVIPMDEATYRARESFFWGPRSVFWHRAYLQNDRHAEEVEDVLRRWEASVMVLGHTAVPEVQERYGGRVIAAHTPHFGAQMVLIARQANGTFARYRISAWDEPRRL